MNSSASSPTAGVSGAPPPAFLVDPGHPWSGDREELRLTQAKTPDEMVSIGIAVQGLKEFKAFLHEKVTLETFTTPDDLAAKVTSSLFPWLLEQLLEPLGDGADPATPPADLTGYLEDLVDRTDHINISGIATQHTRGALRYPIERLYTPLASRGLPGREARPGAGDAALGLRHEPASSSATGRSTPSRSAKDFAPVKIF